MKKRILTWLRNWAIKIALGLTAWQSVLVNIFLNRIVPFVYKIASSWMAWRKIEKAKEQDEEKRKAYEENLKDKVSEDDQKKSTTDFLNS